MQYIELFTFTFVAFLLVASPGPNGLLFVRTMTAHGNKNAYSNILGFILALYLHGILSSLGISALINSSEKAFFALKFLGALYLAYLGIKSLLNAFKSIKSKNENIQYKYKSLKSSFSEGFLTCALNPKVSMFYLAAFAQFISLDKYSVFYVLLLITIHCLINFLWFTSILLLIKKIKFAFKNIKLQKVLEGFTGIVFIAFGLKLLSLDAK